ncbi:MAG: hypothetical protein RLZZ502_1326 [Pseudomonadota bacterium]|jgi:TetR/AcrR family transcriptional regulator
MTSVKEQIEQVAIQLFADLGYLATSMNLIAERAEVSKSLLYHYFASKADLLTACLNEQVHSLQSLLEQANEEKNARDKIKAVVRLYLGAYAQAQAALKVLLNDTHHLPKAVADPIIKGQAHIVKTVNKWCAEELKCAEKNAQARTMALFGMMNWSFTWLKPNGSLSHEQYAEIVIDLFFNGIHT